MNEKDLHYYLYRDDDLIKSIYSQLEGAMPDLGVIEYFGGDTRNFTKDYRIEALEENNNDKQKEYLKSELKVCNMTGSGILREYANISDIKEIKQNSFYNNIVNEINNKCNNYNELIYINDKIETYPRFNDQKEIFLKMGEYCIWIKKELVNLDIAAISKLMGKLNLVGFILKMPSEDIPMVVRAIAIYL